ncbi:hypothetical protein pb186bvf_005164 [Paramecium bursaria]
MITQFILRNYIQPNQKSRGFKYKSNLRYHSFNEEIQYPKGNYILIRYKTNNIKQQIEPQLQAIQLIESSKPKLRDSICKNLVIINLMKRNYMKKSNTSKPNFEIKNKQIKKNQYQIIKNQKQLNKQRYSKQYVIIKQKFN